MKISRSDLPATIGAPLGGGFFAGTLKAAEKHFALICSPKTGEHGKAIWIPDYKAVPEARHYGDGFANTLAMADAGSALAAWALELRLGGFDDWYIPAQDELEILYRAFKPGTAENSGYGRSGINLSATEPTWPYRTNFPLQTSVQDFRDGGHEAFETDLYWSSTQHASDSDCAWYQGFHDGYQLSSYTYGKLRARAVRRLEIQ